MMPSGFKIQPLCPYSFFRGLPKQFTFHRLIFTTSEKTAFLLAYLCKKDERALHENCRTLKCFYFVTNVVCVTSPFLIFFIFILRLPLILFLLLFLLNVSKC